MMIILITMMNIMNCKNFQSNLTEHYLMIDDNEDRENYKTLKTFRLLKTLRLFIAFVNNAYLRTIEGLLKP